MKRGFELGVIAGLLLVVLIGWIPVVGPFLAGFVSGLHTKHEREGAAVGFVSGALGSVIIAWMLYIAFVEFFVIGADALSGVVGNVFNVAYSFGPIALIVQITFFATIGGVFGARVREHWSA